MRGRVLSHLVGRIRSAPITEEGTMRQSAASLGMDANIRRTSTVNAAATVIDAVRRVAFGPVTTFRNLGLLALSTNGDYEADYLTLDEALERHSAHIVEVSEGGRVPELK